MSPEAAPVLAIGKAWPAGRVFIGLQAGHLNFHFSDGWKRYE
jgi:hypothetical protein